MSVPNCGYKILVFKIISFLELPKQLKLYLTFIQILISLPHFNIYFNLAEKTMYSSKRIKLSYFKSEFLA